MKFVKWCVVIIVCAVLFIPSDVTRHKTVKIGTGLKTGEDFLSAMLDNKCGVSYYGRKMILSPEFKIADKETRLELVVVEVAELGFRDVAKLGEIYARAKERKGLLPCPAEVGPQLRMQYKEQPVGEVLVMAMEKINLSTGFARHLQC